MSRVMVALSEWPVSQRDDTLGTAAILALGQIAQYFVVTVSEHFLLSSKADQPRWF